MKLALIALSVTPLLTLYVFMYQRWAGERYKLVRNLESNAIQVVQEVLSPSPSLKPSRKNPPSMFAFWRRRKRGAPLALIWLSLTLPSDSS
jgi:hypothetical protein